MAVRRSVTRARTMTRALVRQIAPEAVAPRYVQACVTQRDYLSSYRPRLFAITPLQVRVRTSASPVINDAFNISVSTAPSMCFGDTDTDCVK